MTTCRNCRSSLPDGSKFCSMCGYQTGELPNQQPQVMHAAHHQSVANQTRHLNKIRSGYRPSWQVIGISSVILVTIIAFSTLFIVNISRKNSNVAITSNANLVPAGKAIPGQTLQVVGNHFPVGQTVFLTLDGQPLVNNGTTARTWRLSAVNLASASSANVSGTPVAVGANGTFTVTIHIDSNWKVGSIHHLTISNQQGKELKSLDLTVEGDQSKPATSATGTIEIKNIDMQNPLYLPAGTILTNTAGCTAQKLQISLDSDVNLDAYSGEYNYPRIAVPIHVVQPGTTGNIQDCREGYAFHYCSPACDGSEIWNAYDTNGGFSGGTDAQQ